MSRRALLALLALPVLGCTADERPANLLLVTLDTTRVDHLSIHGYERDTTPRLRSLAEEGTQFVQAYAPMATTGPTHASLFTALYPMGHGIVRNGVRLAEEHRTLSEILQEQGYQTAAFVSSFVLDRRFGFEQGFDTYDDTFERGTATMPDRKEWANVELDQSFDRRGDETARRAIHWLREGRSRDRPFFLFVHFFDPHAPMVPPQPFASRFAGEPGGGPLTDLIGRYDGEIAFADAQVGALLDVLESLGLDGNTLVAVTADHGEGLMQHGQLNHGVHIYEEAVRVPLLLRWPGRIPARRSVHEPVELVDLAPTLLELIGVDADNVGFQGQSLAAVLSAGAVLDPERPIHLQRRHYEGQTIGGEWVAGEKFGIRVGRWKYIEDQNGEARELFDLTSDPRETVDRTADAPEQAKRLAEQIAAWKAAHRRHAPLGSELTPEERRGLEALGYLEPGRDHSEEPSSTPSPP